MKFLKHISLSKLVLLVLTFFYCRSGNTQTQDHFEHLTIKDGLAHSIIFSVTQDKKGFMWFATQDGGLNKYDGYSFEVFVNDPNNENSLASNNVSKVICDTKGNIWIGTWGAGLDKYDPEKEKFTHYKNNPTNTNSLSHNNAQTLLEDKDGNIWIGTAGGGLNKLEVSSGKFTCYKFIEGDSTSLSNDRVWSLAQDKNGKIWVGTSEGLCFLNPKTGKFKRYVSNYGKEGSISHPKVRAVHIDKYDRVWVGTTAGLDMLNTLSDRFIHYTPYPEDKETAETNEVNVIYSDSQGGLWVGTHAGGLCKFNPKNKKFKGFRHNSNEPYSISYNDIRDIAEDRSGILWITTRGAGVNKFDLKPVKFMHYAAQPENKKGLQSSRVRTIYASDKNKVWLGTDGGGLSEFDLITSEFKNFVSLPGDFSTLSSNRVRAVYDDGEGKVWIGTDGSGLNLFDKKTGKIQRFENISGNNNSLIDNDILVIAGAGLNKVWIGTDNGMDLFDYDKNEFTHFQSNPDDSTTLTNNRVWSVFTDRDGDVWVGTDDGLNLLNVPTGKVKRFLSEPGKKDALSNNDIYCIMQDSKNRIWIGTGRGLNCFDKSTEKFSYYTEKNGLPGNSVYSILEAENGEFWISTLNGLSQFNEKEKTFHNYFSHDGLQSDEFLPGSGFVLENGYMFFGGINGFNVFHPAKVKSNNYIPQIVFTGFSIFNEGIKPGADSPLKKSIHFTESITLNYDQDVISISFAALSYNVSSQNQYAYKLEGFDDDWVYAGHKREASYTSLPPGEYTFRVKASNNDGKWNEEGISMKIIILPPFWQTTWFYILCFVTFGLVVFILIKWREKKLKAANRILEEKVEERTIEINEKNNVLNVQREELEHKHRDIMDSIKYAKRIQEAILPPKHIVERNVYDHFILYKPKDIVSGDFYWTEEKDGKVMIAAVDCTGHGVPGAFVSIVGSNGLNRAVNEFKLTRPHEILDKLNTLVTDSLHQGETESKDGMDLSLCCFDWPKQKVYFAGANNSLYVVSSKIQAEEKSIVLETNDGRKMYELKADKQPIGGASSYNQRPFTHHEIDMVQGDMIYLFTDGFADQFGGPKGKKYKYSQLYKLLAEISSLAMEKQRELLNEAFEKWRGELEQIDDVCVIGIRV